VGCGFSLPVSRSSVRVFFLLIIVIFDCKSSRWRQRYGSWRVVYCGGPPKSESERLLVPFRLVSSQMIYLQKGHEHTARTENRSESAFGSLRNLSRVKGSELP